MRNAVPELGERRDGPADTADDPDGLAAELAERAVAPRQAGYADEVRRLLDAGFAVMRRRDDLDPRVTEIVRESGLSNQVFYRHFRGKDELLLALLEDGRRRLVATIRRRMARATGGAARVQAWIEAVLAQASDASAAAATRPFAVNADRLAVRFPEESRRSVDRLIEPLLTVLGPYDARAVYHVAMGSVHDALVARRAPSEAETEEIVAFALRGCGLGA